MQINHEYLERVMGNRDELIEQVIPAGYARKRGKESRKLRRIGEIYSVKIGSKSGSWDSAKLRTSRQQAKPSEDMSPQDRYIDARLAAIENKLDARMEAMQRFTEQAEQRNQNLIAELKQDAKDASKETKQAGRSTVFNVWMAALSTILGVGAILLASVTAFQSSVSAVQGTVAEQGAWLRQSVDRIERRVEAIPISIPAEAPPAPTPEQQAPSE